jgi:hypothetical protein
MSHWKRRPDLLFRRRQRHGGIMADQCAGTPPDAQPHGDRAAHPPSRQSRGLPPKFGRGQEDSRPSPGCEHLPVQIRGPVPRRAAGGRRPWTDVTIEAGDNAVLEVNDDFFYACQIDHDFALTKGPGRLSPSAHRSGRGSQPDHPGHGRAWWPWAG